MTTDLQQRLRSYGAALDRHADRAEQPGDGHVSPHDRFERPVHVVPLEPTPPRRRVYTAAAAAVLLLATGAGLVLLLGTGDPASEVGTAAEGDPGPGTTTGHPGSDQRRFEPHSDMDGCMAQAEAAVPTNPQTGPEPQEPLDAMQQHWEDCLFALEGEQLAAGAVQGTGWELVASTEPTGRWVQLRAADLEGTFRVSAHPDEAPTGGLFSAIGVCCELAGESLVVSVTRNDVVSIAVYRDGELIVEAPTVSAPDHDHTRFGVLAVPGSGTVQVRFDLADGSSVEPVVGGIDLSHRGG